ncbi:hypothetical protein [Arthrobacter sp. A2-55]|uniref:hypothetical protein n=1 Tax=Arthrobacter sp. A2-55 TaxID=2897337 RepID=UPI0021CDA40B|nr:hypothetical protein [Arthrobacter sp. A2-55]MCU6481311.1 hypothetical protein [Arthrobacter sp. A2-55]
MSMVADHVVEFFETVIEDSPSQEAANESTNETNQLGFPGAPHIATVTNPYEDEATPVSPKNPAQKAENR